MSEISHAFSGSCEASLVHVMRLIGSAAASVAYDRDAARACLDRAAAMLRDEDMELTRGGLAPWQMRRVSHHIETHIAAKITVTELAAVARLSGSHFCRAFSHSFGEPPIAHVARRRIEYAKRLMAENGMPLAEVAQACGLCDQSHFTRVFRRVAGSSPSAWRRLNRTPEGVPTGPS